MAVEEQVSGSVFSFLQLVVDLAWLAIRVDLDLVGNLLQMIFVQHLWLHLSEGCPEGGFVTEVLLSLLLKSCVLFAGKELGDPVEEEDHVFVSLVSNEELADSLKILLVDVFDIFVLLLVHGLDQQLDFFNLV